MKDCLCERIVHSKNGEVKTNISKWRSFMKGVTWETMCFFILGSMLWLVTKSWETVTAFVLIYHGFKVVLYYFHERAWLKCKWGLKND